MALVKCPECGNDVSTQSEKCPKCGAKMPMSKAKKILVGIFFLLIFVILSTKNDLNKENSENKQAKVNIQKQNLEEVKKGVVIEPLKPFVESDFYWDKHTKPYKKLLVEQVNRIRENNPKCRDAEPNVYMSPTKGTKENPVFFVICGKGNEIHNVFFSKSEAQSKVISSAPKALDEFTALQICIETIKKNVVIPESVNAHTFFGKTYRAYPNGNAEITLDFDAKNVFGTERENKARCLIQPSGITDVSFERN